MANLQFQKDEINITLKRLGASEEIRARYVVDCSGRSTVIGNYFQPKKPYANLKKFSVFAHYENVARDEGNEGTNSCLVR